MKNDTPFHNLIFIAIGICAFLFKTLYEGPFKDFVISYWGNFWVSFSIYFIIGFSNKYWRKNDFITAFISIFILEAFEITDGFWGIMTNVSDPLDLIFNIWGVIFAITTEIVFNVLGKKKKDGLMHSTSNKNL